MFRPSLPLHQSLRNLPEQASGYVSFLNKNGLECKNVITCNHAISLRCDVVNVFDDTIIVLGDKCSVMDFDDSCDGGWWEL